jgi:hypothetical protein
VSEPKPFASLSSGLLARKGAAKPAMRPQGFGYGSLEDLGWNDMGHSDPVSGEHVPSSITALTPAPGGRGHHPDQEGVEPAAHEEEVFDVVEPAIVEQQRHLEASFEAPVVDPAAIVEEIGPVQVQAPAPVVSLPRRKPSKKQAVPASAPAKSRSAFTLRLDPDRHLRLRLACAVTRRSAQQIVTGALDEYLSSLPELDALADHVPAEAGKRAG